MTSIEKKRFKRFLRRKLYRFFSALNRLDLRPALPIAAVLLLTAILCLLPTHSDAHTDDASRLAGLLSAGIRSAALPDTTDGEASVTVVALFLPDADELRPDTDIAEVCTDSCLYSIYLTGTELRYLAESAVSFRSSLRDTTLHLNGLSYTEYPLRLPLNRITELSFSDGSPIPASNEGLYRVVCTDSLFTLFHYLSYRSQGIIRIFPKDPSGARLADYEEAILTSEGTPLTLSAAWRQFAGEQALDRATIGSASAVLPDLPVSCVTRLHGFNLLLLLRHPNRITLYLGLLLLVFTLLLWYSIPRIRRVRHWLHIYAIRRKKRSGLFDRRKSSRML